MENGAGDTSRDIGMGICFWIPLQNVHTAVSDALCAGCSALIRPVDTFAAWGGAGSLNRFPACRK